MVQTLIHTLGDLHPLAVHFPIGIIGLILIINILIYYKKINIEISIMRLIHIFALISIFVAIIFGLIMEHTRSYSGGDKDLLFHHKRAGILLLTSFLLATIFLFLYNKKKLYSLLYRVFFLIALFFLSVGGHLGSTITHGEIKIVEILFPNKKHVKTKTANTTAQKNIQNTTSSTQVNSIAYTTEVAVEVKTTLSSNDTETEKIQTNLETTEVKENKKTKTQKNSDSIPKINFASEIYPIFEQNCIKCHGPRKQKGDMRLDTLDYTEIITPFKPDESELVKRISLPADDEDVMPPEDGPLPPETIKLITNWVKQGAITTEETEGTLD